MVIHPDVLAAHAEFGGDLESMQKCYEWSEMKGEILRLREDNERLHRSLVLIAYTEMEGSHGNTKDMSSTWYRDEARRALKAKDWMK